jgi:hypothetical protein
MINFKMTKNNFPNLIKRLKELHNSSLDVGYFPENGVHPSGLTYSGLFAIHSFGSTKAHIPARPVLDLNFERYNNPKNNLLLKRLLKQYLSHIDRKTPPIKLSVMLTKVAGDYVQTTRDLFGNTSVLVGNAYSTIAKKGFDAPLIFQGDLRDNLSYSINGKAVVTPN